MLQARPLDEKIDRALDLIRAALDTGRAFVAFSGGRDSTALVDLARRVDPDVPVVYSNTGLADPRVLAWIRDFGGNTLTELAPRHDPFETWRTEGRRPIGAKTATANYRRQNPELRIDPRACCQKHKAQAMHEHFRRHKASAVLIGARGDDSKRHMFKLQTGEIFRNNRHPWWIAYPLLTWTRADSIAYIDERVPRYPIRYAENEELGCRGCAINLYRAPNDFTRLRRRDPQYFRRLLEEAGFSEEILMLRYGLTRRGARQLIERDGLDALIDAGAFDQIPKAKKARE